MWVIASLIFFVAPIIAYKDFNLAITIFSIAIPTAIKTNPANTDAIEKYITSVKTFLSLKKTHELSPTNFFLTKAKNVSSEQIRVDF